MSDEHALSHLLQDLEHDAVRGKIMHDVFSALGDSIKDLASRCRGGIDPNAFLTTPKRLSDGSCLALINEALDNSNTYRMIATSSSPTVHWITIFRENPKDLSRTVFVQPEEEQLVELHRQLNLITRRQAANTTNIYTLVFFKQEIPEYSYFEDASEKAMDFLSKNAVPQHKASQPVDASTGPTPVPLSRQGATVSARSGLSGLPTNQGPTRSRL